MMMEIRTLSKKRGKKEYINRSSKKVKKYNLGESEALER